MKLMETKISYKTQDIKLRLLMKRFSGILLIFISLFNFSCIEQEYPLFKDSLVEWDATVMNNPVLGKDFPLLVRVPRPTFALAPSDPLITRRTGTLNLRVNFVSPQKGNDEIISLRIVTDETTAVEDVHYSVNGQVTIEANSSFADVQVQILDPGPGTGSVDLVLELIGNSVIRPSEKYKRIGIRISQM